MSVQAQSSMLKVRLLSTIESVNEMRECWNRLSGGIPFRRWEWQQAWWNQYRNDNLLFVVVVADGSRTVGIAPWYLERSPSSGSVVRFLGSGEVCSDYQSILAKSGYETQVAQTIAAWLNTCEAADPAHNHHADAPRWDLMELAGIDPKSSCTLQFVQQLAKSGFTVHERRHQNCWRIPLPHSFDEYLAGLSKPNRRRVRWSEKRLRMPDCQVLSAQSEPEFEALWQVFVDLHQRRRQSLGQSGCFASERFARFLHDASLTFLKAESLDLICIRIANQPVATELSFRGHGVTFAYQIGIHPDSLRDNPGWLVNTVSIQNAIRLGHVGFDLCRGDEEYKRHLGAEPTPCAEYRIVPPRLRAQIRHAAWVTGTAVKDLIKSGLNMTGMR